MKRSTNLVIISGPSGAGEDSIIEGMRDRGIPIERVVTSITRPMRKGEVQGKAYYYISHEEFQILEDNNDLVEKAIVYGDNRGVTKKELERVQAQKDKVGIWKIDFKGLITAKKVFPDILSIFISADLDDLINRLKKRGDDEKTIKERTEYTKEYLSHADEYDYTVVNAEGKLNEAIDKTIEILKKEGLVDNIE
jgi:guanylate kinase